MAFLLVPLLLATVGLAAVGWEAADRMVHPERDGSTATPARRGLAYERVEFASEDGVPLVGWWMPAEPGSPVVVFLHGYQSSKVQSLAVAPFLHEAGYAVLAFDFRAHGDSGGDRTTLGLEEPRDVRGALAWLRERDDADTENIVLFGWSMGAAAAIRTGAEPGVRGIVTDSGFAALDEVIWRVIHGATGLPAFPFAGPSTMIASLKLGHAASEDRPAASARSLSIPLFIIQGLEDDLANESDAKKLHEAAPLSQVWLVPGAAHTGARRADPAGYESRVVDFLEQAFEA